MKLLVATGVLVCLLASPVPAATAQDQSSPAGVFWFRLEMERAFPH